ncbi:MAG: hypothetical protein IKO48_07260 [Elusimicrobia bacterium]|nr:hypothetical protein [Elusimicrobiota bacterium]
MENAENLEKINLPETTVNAIVSDLCIGLVSHDKIAKKYKVSPDTITKISRLFGERIGQVKKEIRDSVLATTKTWATKTVENLQDITKDILTEMGLKKKREKASLSQLAMAMAIAVDKIQLLSGGVTQRTETVKMTSKSEILDLLTDGKRQNQKYIEKSTSFESANFEKNNEKIEDNSKVTKVLIKNILKNQQDLIN